MKEIVRKWLESIKEKNYTKEEIYDLLKSPKMNKDVLYSCAGSNSYTEYIVANELKHDGYMAIAWWLHEQLEDFKPKIKKDIRIIIADGTKSSEYVDFLSKRFNVTVVKNGEECDLVVFTGGEDVNPEYYYQKAGKYTSFNDRRDKIEKEVYNKYRNVPKLGVCRGNQFLTVMNGGQLIQHLNGHGATHEIIYRDFSVFPVTSTHHQASYPFNLPETSYKILGYSKHFKSGTYLNGNNEEIDIPKNFVEVEIIKFKNCLGIQGHPEYGSAEEPFINISLNLIEELIFNTEKFNKEINNEKEEYYEV